jgi:hypothetical protein
MNTMNPMQLPNAGSSNSSGALPLTANTAQPPTTGAGPSQAEIDKQRVTLLLEINSHLLELIQTLQQAGKGGDVQSPANPSEPAEQKKPSREYVEPLRRMQANLAYLASLAERHQKPGAQAPPWPQVMTAPPGDEKLSAMYARLQSLFPAWRVQQQRMAAAQAAQAQQAAGGAGAVAGQMGMQQQMMGGGVGMGMGMQQQQGGGEQGSMG